MGELAECRNNEHDDVSSWNPVMMFSLGFFTAAMLLGVGSKLWVKQKNNSNDATKSTLDLMDSDEEDEEEDEDVPMDKQFKMVLCVNMDLKMGKGKIAAQCCHACLGTFRRAPADFVRSWASQGQPKIALKAPNLDELMEIAVKAQSLGLPCYVVADAGRTQIAAGSRTVCGILGPVKRLDQITGHLKLL